MNRTMLSTMMYAALLAVGGLGGVACSSNAPAAEDRAETGSVTLPLVTSTNGHTYRLRNAYVEIWGPQYSYLYTDVSPEATTISRTLQTGDYTAYLYYWTLERDQGDGTFGPVSATLLNPYNYFTIANGTTSTLVFQFQTDGVVVVVGSGQVNVQLAVNEVAPVCTPFGGDCGSGSWCPPAGLTGQALACYPEGSTPVGDPCRGPGDCVANATCIDLGKGPACTALCPTDSFGTPCATGGTCVRCRYDYGVCLPAGEAGVPTAAPAGVCPPGSDGGPRWDASVQPDAGHWW